MTISPADGEALWDKFLDRWPLEKLGQITLQEYSEAGNNDSFTNWLESITENLGSIWGGSAFKFGVYSRDDLSEKRDGAGRSYSKKYAWYSKYGSTAEEVFEKVRQEIIKIATAARSGDLAQVDAADLGEAVKWKLAFLYQNRETPCVLPIYKSEWLRVVLHSTDKRVSVLQKQIIENISGKHILEYYDEVLSLVKEELSTELSPEEADSFFKRSDQFTQIKPPTQKIAGYVNSQGMQLALALDNKKTTLYFKAGDWLNRVKDKLKEVESYPTARSRSSNLAANAPQLALGNAIVKVVVPTMAVLIEVCDAYDSEEILVPESTISTSSDKFFPMPPLNQILYGPPGTGKTYATIDEALRILDPEFLYQNENNRSALKNRFDSFCAAGHIRFVTFHQSFCYEDFVEGLRAENNEDGQLCYEVVDGVFKNLCDSAAAKVTQSAEAPIDLTGRKIWKMSLGNSLGWDAYIFEECIANGYALLGYGGLIDFSGCENRGQISDRLVELHQTETKDSYAVTAVSTFILKMKVGDLLVVTEGNTKFRAIGEVTGNYRCLKREEGGDEYGQCRDVKWLRVYKPSIPYDQLMHNQFSQMTLYELRSGSIDMSLLAGLLRSKDLAIDAEDESLIKAGDRFSSGYEVRNVSAELLELEKPNGKILPIGMSILNTLASYVKTGQIEINDIRERKVFEKVPETRLDPYLVNGYSNILPFLVEALVSIRPIKNSFQAKEQAQPQAKVLIIDEINRGNISRIFGELITLIETSKRSGNDESLEVILPYSKKTFSVPSNVYLIGTMNTTDRSLASLDIALRRRFTFKEMPPKPELLENIDIDGVNIGELLRTMNERIEVLLDRDHCLGHAYFMPLKEDNSLPKLASIFQQQIFPLLEEYFFEDWERIAWVLNDQNKDETLAFIQKATTNLTRLFDVNTASNLQNNDRRWRINEDSFANIESYRAIVRGNA